MPQLHFTASLTAISSFLGVELWTNNYLCHFESFHLYLALFFVNDLQITGVKQMRPHSWSLMIMGWLSSKKTDVLFYFTPQRWSCYSCTIRPNCLDLLSLRKSNFVSVSKFQLPSHEKCIWGSKCFLPVLMLRQSFAFCKKRNEKRKDVQNEGHHLVTVMLQQWVIQMSWDNRKEEEKVVSKQASSIWKRKTVAAS